MRYCIILFLALTMSLKGKAQEIETIDKFASGYINGTYMNKFKSIDGVEVETRSIMFTLIVVVLPEAHSREQVSFRKYIFLRQLASLAMMPSLDASPFKLSTMRGTMCPQLVVSMQIPEDIMGKSKKSLVITSQVAHVSPMTKECR